MREWYSKHLGLADKGQGAMLPWREHDDPQKEHVTVRRDFAVFPVQGQRGLRRLKRYFGDKMSVGAQMVVVLKAFVERSVSLVLAHPFEFSWLDVSQTYVFHCSSAPGGSQPSLARWIVHPIVVAHRKNRQPRRIVFRAGETEQFGCFRRQEPSQGRLPGKAAIRPS